MLVSLGTVASSVVSIAVVTAILLEFSLVNALDRPMLVGYEELYEKRGVPVNQNLYDKCLFLRRPRRAIQARVACCAVGRAGNGVSEELGSGNAVEIAEASIPGVRGSAPAAARSGFVASEGRRKFHLPECPWAAAFVRSSRCRRFATRSEAVKAGYRQCKTCWP
jgi:hypothetical protein